MTKKVFESVITLIDETIFDSMDSAHAADVDNLRQRLLAFETCDKNLNHRLTVDGDLGGMQADLRVKQDKLNDAAGTKALAEAANSTAWDSLETHMHMIGSPPSCPDFPQRAMRALDVYFGGSLYEEWFAAQSVAYGTERDAFAEASEKLAAAIQAYNVVIAVRDTEYCDWHGSFLAACDFHDNCHRLAK